MASDSGGSFCPSCGKPVASDDRFCRACGTSLASPSEGTGTTAAPTPSEPSPPAAIETAEAKAEPRSYWRWIGAFGGVAAVAAVVIVVLVLRDPGASEPSAVKQDRSRLKEPFDALMENRDAFFTLERQFLSALNSANTKYTGYQDALTAYHEESDRITAANEPGYAACQLYYDVPCPSPDYPDPPLVPDFAPDVEQLRAALTGLQQLQASLGSLDTPKRLDVLKSQLTSAVATLIDQSGHDADVLSESAYATGNCDDCIDKGKFSTLRTEDALAAIKEMNVAALRVIRQLELKRSNYDVPGGRDLDPADHSTLK